MTHIHIFAIFVQTSRTNTYQNCEYMALLKQFHVVPIHSNIFVVRVARIFRACNHSERQQRQTALRFSTAFALGFPLFRAHVRTCRFEAFGVMLSEAMRCDANPTVFWLTYRCWSNWRYTLLAMKCVVSLVLWVSARHAVSIVQLVGAALHRRWAAWGSNWSWLEFVRLCFRETVR